MSVIEKALLKATKIKSQSKTEDRQKYLSRLVAGVQKLSDDAWDDLESTEGAQEWVNAGVDAEAARKPIKDFPDLESDDEDDDVDDDTSPPPSAKSGKTAPKSADKASAKSDKKVAVDKSPDKDKNVAVDKPQKKPDAPVKDTAPKKQVDAGSKKGAMWYQLKLLVVKKPKLSIDELTAALEKKGFESPSRLTVSTIRSDTRNTLKVLKDAGILPDIEV